MCCLELSDCYLTVKKIMQTVTWNTKEWLRTLRKLWLAEHVVCTAFVPAIHSCYAGFLMDQKNGAGPAVMEVILTLFSSVKMNLLFPRYRFSCSNPLLFRKNQVFHACSECVGKVEIYKENIFCRWRTVLLQLFWKGLVFASATKSIVLWLELQISVVIVSVPVLVCVKEAEFCSSE